MTKMLKRGLFRKRSGWPQKRHCQRTLQAATGGNNFSPYRSHRLSGKWSAIFRLQLPDDLGLALRAQHRSLGVMRVLDLAHLHGGLGSQIEQIQNFSVNLINPLAQRQQLGLQ